MSCTSASYDVISQTSWLCRNRHAMMRGVYINRKGAFCFNSRLHMHMTDLKSRSKLLQLVYLRRWWLKWFVEFRNKSIISVQTFPKQYFVLFEIYQATGPQWKQNSWVCWWRWNLTTCLNSAFQSGKCCFQYQKVSGFSVWGGQKKHPTLHPSPFWLQEEVTRLTELNSPEAAASASPKSSPQGRLPVMQPKSFTDPKTVPLPEEEVQILELNAQGGLWQSEAFQEDLQATWIEGKMKYSILLENGGWEFGWDFFWGGLVYVFSCWLFGGSDRTYDR